MAHAARIIDCTMPCIRQSFLVWRRLPETYLVPVRKGIQLRKVLVMMRCSRRTSSGQERNHGEDEEQQNANLERADDKLKLSKPRVWHGVNEEDDKEVYRHEYGYRNGVRPI